MSTKRKIIVAVVAVAVVGGIVAVVATRGGDSGAKETVIVPRPVERRTLDDILTVSGVLEREEIRKINSPVDGRVSDVFVDDGEEVVEGAVDLLPRRTGRGCGARRVLVLPAPRRRVGRTRRPPVGADSPG